MDRLFTGREVDTGTYIKNSNSCSMCKRIIINAGITSVIIRDTEEKYRVIDVNDESLLGEFGY